MTRKVGWGLSLVVLFVTGALGAYDGVRGLAGARTPLQYSVTAGVILYGVLGLAAGAAMAARHPWSVWLSTLWGIVVTYVSATAALAYAGADATVRGAVASGVAGALIAAGVIWSARASARSSAAGRRTAGRAARTLATVAVVSSSAVGLDGCLSLYQEPPVVGEGDGLRSKRVRAKREPDRLIAEDLTVCWVIPEVFVGIKPGDNWRCDWRPVPAGM